MRNDMQTLRHHGNIETMTEEINGGHLSKTESVLFRDSVTVQNADKNEMTPPRSFAH